MKIFENTNIHIFTFSIRIHFSMLLTFLEECYKDINGLSMHTKRKNCEKLKFKGLAWLC